MSKFFYYSDASEVEKLGRNVFFVPKDLVRKQDVFHAYGVGLSAPNGYFGENWDAFNDCLMDLQWIEKPEVFVAHMELPRLSRHDIAIYLDILRSATQAWSDEKTAELCLLFPELIPHRLSVFFPREAEDIVSFYDPN